MADRGGMAAIEYGVISKQFEHAQQFQPRDTLQTIIASMIIDRYPMEIIYESMHPLDVFLAVGEPMVSNGISGEMDSPSGMTIPILD